MIRYLRASGLGLLLASSTLSAAIQPAASPQVPTPPSVQQPALPQPSPVWPRRAALELTAYVEQIGREGLDPADYSLSELRTAISSGDETGWSAIASDVFRRLSGDLSGRWDQERLAQMLSNLIGNAVHHGAADAPIQIAASGTTEEIEISIHNDGEIIEKTEVRALSVRLEDPSLYTRPGGVDESVQIGRALERAKVKLDDVMARWTELVEQKERLS